MIGNFSVWQIQRVTGNFNLSSICLQYLRIFLIRLFFFSSKNFGNWNTLLRGFLPQKQLIFQVSLQFLWNGTLFQGFLWPKWNPCLRIFCEKVTNLGGTSLYTLTWEYLLPPPHYMKEVMLREMKIITVCYPCVWTSFFLKL